MRRRVAAASLLIAISIAMVPIAYSGEKARLGFDRRIDIGEGYLGSLEGLLGLDRSFKVLESSEVYANLSCGSAVGIMIRNPGNVSTMTVAPAVPTRIPVDDVVSLIVVERAPSCSLELYGSIAYRSYKLLWLTMVSFILGLSGIMVLLRALVDDIRGRLSRAPGPGS